MELDRQLVRKRECESLRLRENTSTLQESSGKSAAVAYDILCARRSGGYDSMGGVSGRNFAISAGQPPAGGGGSIASMASGSSGGVGGSPLAARVNRKHVRRSAHTACSSARRDA
eukprot:scaffold118910_cov30-Tisochrysis_lutea.AAC.2